MVTLANTGHFTFPERPEQVAQILMEEVAG